MVELLLNKIFWSVFILFIWFKTDAFTQYFSFLKPVKRYKEYRKINCDITFTEYLLLKYPNFFSKLISCDVCLLFWIIIFVSHIFGFSYFPFSYILSFVIYRLVIKL
jgi:hypothetical protein